jgi:hypothetical protein
LDIIELLIERFLIFVLAAIPFDNISHSDENLSYKIAETLTANQFKVEKIFSMTRDDAKTCKNVEGYSTLKSFFSNYMIEIEYNFDFAASNVVLIIYLP